MKKLQICAAALAAALFAAGPVLAQTAEKAKTKTATMPQEKGDPESPKTESGTKKAGPKKARVKTATTPQEKGDPESPMTASGTKKAGPKKPRVKTATTPQEKGDPESPM